MPLTGTHELLKSQHASILDVIIKWPLLLLNDVQYGMYVPAIVALGAGYYVGGGLPGGGQSLQTYAMAYGAAGLGYYGGLMFSQRGAPGLDKV